MPRAKKTMKTSRNTSKKKTIKQTVKQSKKETTPPVVTYDVKKEEAKQRSSDGFIKHPWYKLAAAAVVAALFGWLFRRFKK